MNAKIEKQGDVEVFTISVPVSERPSASGKTTVIASTNGNKPTSIEYKGKTVIVGLNAYYK